MVLIEVSLLEYDGSNEPGETTMNLRRAGLSMAGMCLILTGALVVAQDDPSLRAGRKILGDDQEGHHAVLYQNHARDYVHLVYYNGNSEKGLTPVQAENYISQAKKNLDLSNKSLSNIQAGHPNDPKVKTSIASIQAHHAKVIADCDVVHAECVKPKSDPAKISDGCVDISEQLQAAQNETNALLKYLKVDKLPAPRKLAKSAAK
ncbi:MAG: hypothetical protein JWM11_4472 [Planctomycetaceae bacterium]|nr:hypothetical protein [Planctomycetaceae bacterium]